jgi:hypothetical protein
MDALRGDRLVGAGTGGGVGGQSDGQSTTRFLPVPVVPDTC